MTLFLAGYLLVNSIVGQHLCACTHITSTTADTWRRAADNVVVTCRQECIFNILLNFASCKHVWNINCKFSKIYIKLMSMILRECSNNLPNINHKHININFLSQIISTATNFNGNTQNDFNLFRLNPQSHALKFALSIPCAYSVKRKLSLYWYFRASSYPQCIDTPYEVSLKGYKGYKNIFNKRGQKNNAILKYICTNKKFSSFKKFSALKTLYSYTYIHTYT